MTDVSLDVTIDLPSLKQAQAEAETALAKQLTDGTQAILEFIEGVQIKKYTESDHPPRLKYQRTFRLRNASRTEITSKQLPNIEGLWDVDEGEAPYADEVIGPRSVQKPIHRGRWRSLEDVEQEASDEADGIMETFLKGDIVIQ